MFALLASLLFLLNPSAGPEGAGVQGIQYKLESELVVVQVYVLDGEGNPVRGLSPGDFEVKEGRRSCEIASVEFIDFKDETRTGTALQAPERADGSSCCYSTSDFPI